MLVLALVLFGAKTAFIVLSPMRALAMSTWLIDDSFIVARIARNVALGHGFSFDGTNMTTGVSMLWTYMTSLNHMIFEKEIAAKATLVASTFFGALSTIIVYFLGLKLSGKAAAWIGFILVSLLPMLFFNAMNGMETAFFTFLIILLIPLCAGVFDDSLPGSRRGSIAGLLAGMALMTRADAMFAIAAGGLLYGWKWYRAPSKRRDVLNEMIFAAIALACCVALLFLWQMQQTGSLLPDNQIGRRAISLQKHNFSFDAFSLPAYAKIVVWNGFELIDLWTLAIGSGLLAILAMLMTMPDKRAGRLAVATTLYVLFFSAALILYQWYFPDFHGFRYINPAVHLTAVLFAIFLVNLPLGRWKQLLIPVFIVALLIQASYDYFDFARRPSWAKHMAIFGQYDEAKQKAFWGSYDWIVANLSIDTVIVGRDHGRMAFFTDRPIQDFAGIIDPAILVAEKEGKLAEYLKARKAQYIYLPEKEKAGAIFKSMHEQLKLELMKDVPSEEDGIYSLYRIK